MDLAQQLKGVLDSIPIETRRAVDQMVNTQRRRLESRHFKGEAGAGIVCVYLDMNGKIVKTEVDLPPNKENQELLASLFTAAHNSAVEVLQRALRDAEENMRNQLRKIMSVNNG